MVQELKRNSSDLAWGHSRSVSGTCWSGATVRVAAVILRSATVHGAAVTYLERSTPELYHRPVVRALFPEKWKILVQILSPHPAEEGVELRSPLSQVSAVTSGAEEAGTGIPLVS